MYIMGREDLAVVEESPGWSHRLRKRIQAPKQVVAEPALTKKNPKPRGSDSKADEKKSKPTGSGGKGDEKKSKPSDAGSKGDEKKSKSSGSCGKGDEKKSKPSGSCGKGDEDVSCQECGLGDRGTEILLCDKCNRGYHMGCLRPVVVRVPAGPWFCPRCSKEGRLKEFPLVQTKIIDFFRIQKSPQCQAPQENYLGCKKRRKRASNLAVAKRKRRLLPFNPTQDPKRRLEQMGSLATALITSGVEFSNKLTYMPGMAPRSANRANLEKGGMQVMCKEDKAALELCEAKCRRGEWPPLMVVFDPCEGFTVEADGPIKDLTVITEYVGDVDYLSNRENDEGDSIMTLLLAEDPSKSLVICPDKRGNIARFINGINNHTAGGRRKQNLKCVRYDVDGECRALLVAIRDISKGERLYYDYNGYEKEYPTEHFV